MPRAGLSCGVGFLDGAPRKHFLYARWWSMLSRCYRKKDKCFPSYGGKNKSVDKRWFSFANFIKDVVLLDGYDEELAKKGLLCLDKDKSGHDTYSPENCCWLSEKENVDLSKDTVQISQKIFVATRIEDGYVEISDNQVKFAKKYGLTRSHISAVLHNLEKRHKGWVFKFLENYEEESI